MLQAVVNFSREVFARCGLQLQWSKTEYFCWRGGLPDDCPADLKLAGAVVDGAFRRGFLCWGVPVGEYQYVSSVLSEKVDQIVTEARTALDQLQQSRQAAWAALKWSVWPRFEYWAQHCYPSDSIPAAKVLDQRLWSLLEDVCGFSISHQGQRGADSGECSVSSPDNLREGWSFAAWVARQPVKLQGDGLEILC